MIDFDKIVHKLGKKKGEFIDIDDIADIVDPDFRKHSLDKKSVTYKMLYRLRSNNIILPVRQGLYYIPKDIETNIDGIIEEQYWIIVKKILARELGGEYFISGSKALEILMKDYSAPKKLIITGSDEVKNLQISSSYSLSIRPITSGKKTGNKNIYSFLKKYTNTIEIDGEKLRIACPELAILDSLLIRSTEDGVDQYLIEKFLKRSSKILSRDVFGKLVSMKYITPINRLRAITKDIKNIPIYEICVDIIKKEGGGCFITGTK